MMVTLADCPLRISQLLSVDIDHVSFEPGGIVLGFQPSQTKTRIWETRTLPLEHEPAIRRPIELRSAYPLRSPALFVSKFGRRLTRTDAWAAFTHRFEPARQERRCPHGVRRGMARYVTENFSHEVDIITDVLSQKDERMRRIYSAAEDRKMAERMLATIIDQKDREAAAARPRGQQQTLEEAATRALACHQQQGDTAPPPSLSED